MNEPYSVMFMLPFFFIFAAARIGVQVEHECRIHARKPVRGLAEVAGRQLRRRARAVQGHVVADPVGIGEEARPIGPAFVR